MNEEMIDQSVLAEDLSEKIKFDFFDYFLVKPLDPIKVMKEVSKPVSTGTPVKDANDVEAQDFDGVETKTEECNSDFRKGIVLKRPLYYEKSDDGTNDNLKKINIGDVVIFRDFAGFTFDLLKDSKLLRQYDVLGIVTQ